MVALVAQVNTALAAVEEQTPPVQQPGAARAITPVESPLQTVTLAGAWRTDGQQAQTLNTADMFGSFNAFPATLDRNQDGKVTSQDLHRTLVSFLKEQLARGDGSGVDVQAVDPAGDSLKSSKSAQHNSAQLLKLFEHLEQNGTTPLSNSPLDQGWKGLVQNYNKVLQILDQAFPEGLTQAALTKQFDGFGSGLRDGRVSLEEFQGYFKQPGKDLQADTIQAMEGLFNSAARICGILAKDQQLSEQHAIDPKFAKDLGTTLNYFAKAVGSSDPALGRFFFNQGVQNLNYLADK